jgi:hypothetical protein
MNTTKQLGVVLAAVLLLACVPAFAGASVVDKLTTLFIYMLLATTWNLMAGYAGLVSVGQQAFFGLSGYLALRLVDGGLPAYPALLAGALGAALLAWLLSFYVLRLKDGEFAIGTWVVAEVIRILVMLDPLIQGETGTSLIRSTRWSPSCAAASATGSRWPHWLAWRWPWPCCCAATWAPRPRPSVTTTRPPPRWACACCAPGRRSTCWPRSVRPWPAWPGSPAPSPSCRAPTLACSGRC